MKFGFPNWRFLLKYVNGLVNIRLYKVNVQGKSQFIPDTWSHIKSFEVKLKLLRFHLKKTN